MNRSGSLVIFEGPDGGGKTSAAKKYAERTGSALVHLGPFKNVGVGALARLYAEAMMPAVLGHCDVVMDRCWISEEPYGRAFRNGLDRLGVHHRRILERLALRCQTQVVLMLPPWSTVRENFNRRRGEEMLKTYDQLEQVFNWYGPDGGYHSALPTSFRNYLQDSLGSGFDTFATEAHPIEFPTAGNILARAVIVGESFAEHQNADPLYRWPFASFDDPGCSTWLSRRLEEAKIGEENLCWVNADAPSHVLKDLAERVTYPATVPTVYALGKLASDRLTTLRIAHRPFDHPQYWRRFHSTLDYPLIADLKETIQ